MRYSYTAHEVAADSELLNQSWLIPKSKLVWECIGYSRTGDTILFARLKQYDDIMRVKQINRYLKPDDKCILVTW